MLSIVTSKRKIREFLVYDMEWVPGTLQIRIVGVYDGIRYRSYPSVDAFIRAEFTASNRGKWFYAHAGGMADIQFVFERLIHSREFKVRASFSGSSAIIVHISRGKNAWHCIDSYWLFRDKLANIGKSIGMLKGGVDDGDPDAPNISEIESQRRAKAKRDWYAAVALPELREYNEQDCRILWHAIHAFQSEVLALGGQLQMTIASTGMQLFRRRFLTQSIDTDPLVNENARASYFASRVEVFQREVNDAYYYDINSSFPFSMTHPCPGEYLGTTRRLPIGGKKIYIADAEVETPDTNITSLPIRLDGRVFFPVGRWRNWISSVDLELLVREGGKIHKVYEVMLFEPFDDLADYVTTLYDLRKATSDEFQRIVYKYLLNCVYGKFAESPVKRQMHIDPERTDGMEMLMPGVWFAEKIVPVPHMHVPIATHVTSLSRKWIYDYLSLCRDFHYCDTDGFSTSERLSTSPELGGIKLEKYWDDVLFVAPKLYGGNGRVLGKNGWEQIEYVKAKGFSRMTPERFNRLVEGEAISYERMIRIRELYRRGMSQPTETTIEKRIRLDQMIPKRHTYPDGSTRPWHISELRSVFK